MTTPSPQTGWWVLDHPSDVLQAKGSAVALLDRHLRELLRPHDRLHVLDVHPLAVGASMNPPVPTDEALRVLEHPGIDGIGGGLHHAFERNAVPRQLARIDLDVPLLEPLAVDVHRRDPGTRISCCRIFQ